MPLSVDSLTLLSTSSVCRSAGQSRAEVTGQGGGQAYLSMQEQEWVSWGGGIILLWGRAQTGVPSSWCGKHWMKSPALPRTESRQVPSPSDNLISLAGGPSAFSLKHSRDLGTFKTPHSCPKTAHMGAHLGSSGDALPLGLLFQLLGHHGLLLLCLVRETPRLNLRNVGLDDQCGFHSKGGSR